MAKVNFLSEIERLIFPLRGHMLKVKEGYLKREKLRFGPVPLWKYNSWVLLTSIHNQINSDGFFFLL